MPWTRLSTVEPGPVDPAGDAVAAAIVELLVGATVKIVYSPSGAPPPLPEGPAVATATAPGPPGWDLSLMIKLGSAVLAPRTIAAGTGRASADGNGNHGSTPLGEILEAMPLAGLATASGFRRALGPHPAALRPALARALRDTLAAEVLARVVWSQAGHTVTTELIAQIIDFLIELSGSRVESHDLTHGVLITDVVRDEPRLELAYPADIRSAKRAPLLFDGERSLLVVDLQGRARTELQRHRFGRLDAGRSPNRPVLKRSVESGGFVAEATRRLGGIGFYLRADRTIWSFIEGRPVLVRRGEHWTAFPLELAAALEQMIDGGPAAAIVAGAALTISPQRHGAILAIVEDADSLDGIVSLKDRYDLRNAIDPTAMRIETRLHHLIDAEELDDQTLARLAALDGATIVNRHGQLIAYGAIVASADSQYEGARTAAARSLSHSSLVVVKVSADGEITIFQNGEEVATLLGQPAYTSTTPPTRPAAPVVG